MFYWNKTASSWCFSCSLEVATSELTFLSYYSTLFPLMLLSLLLHLPPTTFVYHLIGNSFSKPNPENWGKKCKYYSPFPHDRRCQAKPGLTKAGEQPLGLQARQTEISDHSLPSVTNLKTNSQRHVCGVKERRRVKVRSEGGG